MKEIILSSSTYTSRVVILGSWSQDVSRLLTGSLGVEGCGIGFGLGNGLGLAVCCLLSVLTHKSCLESLFIIFWCFVPSGWSVGWGLMELSAHIGHIMP